MIDTTYVSGEKKIELEKELRELKTVIRPAILERLAFAKSLGDLSENAEYHAAREAQGKNESRIQEVEAILKTAVLVEHGKSDKIILESVVTVKRETDKQEMVLTIVGQEEADMAEGKVSFVSPLGSALFGKKKGETVVVVTPKGKVNYTIEKVA